MSEEELVFEDTDEIELIEDEQDNEQELLIKQELIALVKVNPALYAKNWKEYAGINFCKDLAWESIGFNLSKKMSGKDAAKMWYNIRQRFGKERRKVVTSLKGKSGQGTKPVYVPKWKFYDLCLFLVDHITPRKTVSNYTSKNVKNTTTIGKISPSPIFILPSPSLSPLSAPRSIPPQALSPQVPSSQILSSQLLSSQILSPQVLSPRVASPQALSPRAPSPQVPSPQAVLSPSSIWSTSDLESAFSGDSASGFSIEDDNKENSPSSLNVEEYSALTSKNILKTMQKVSSSTKKVCPEPDNFAKRRKKNDDLLMQAMTKQSTALTSFATKLGNSLVKSSPCSSTLSSASSENDPVLAAIGYALKSVPEEKRLECMMEILQVIKLKYIQ